MAVKDELKALIESLNAATNAVAAEIGKLKDQITELLANPNQIEPADVAAIETGLQAQIDRLNALAADPANPVPPA